MLNLSYGLPVFTGMTHKARLMRQPITMTEEKLDFMREIIKQKSNTKTSHIFFCITSG